jgi:acyl-CoA thioesterase-1
MVALLCGCSKREAPAPKAESQPAPPGAAPAPPPAAADTRPAIVCFGDSITAGFGLDTSQSFPDLLQQDLDRHALKYRVVNLGVSGDTTQDGLARVSTALAEKPAIVLLELGGNDGLRGIPLSITQANLAQMIEAFQAGGTHVVLAGMSLPPNYGSTFIQKFEAMYKDLAAKYRVTLIPFPDGGRGRAQRIHAARRHTPQRRRRAQNRSARDEDAGAAAEMKWGKPKPRAIS